MISIYKCSFIYDLEYLCYLFKNVESFKDEAILKKKSFIEPVKPLK